MEQCTEDTYSPYCSGFSRGVGSFHRKLFVSGDAEGHITWDVGINHTWPANSEFILMSRVVGPDPAGFGIICNLGSGSLINSGSGSKLSSVSN